MAGAHRKKVNSTPELTPLELEVMHVLWEKKDVVAAEVSKALKKTRPLAITTIHTVIGNLEKKGYVKRVPRTERSLRFAPTIRRDREADRWLSKVLRDFFDDSPRLLMTHLLQKEKISEEELKEIQVMLRQKNKKGRV